MAMLAYGVDCFLFIPMIPTNNTLAGAKEKGGSGAVWRPFHGDGGGSMVEHVESEGVIWRLWGVTHAAGSLCREKILDSVFPVKWRRWNNGSQHGTKPNKQSQGPWHQRKHQSGIDDDNSKAKHTR